MADDQNPTHRQAKSLSIAVFSLWGPPPPFYSHSHTYTVKLLLMPLLSSIKIFPLLFKMWQTQTDICHQSLFEKEVIFTGRDGF